MTPVGPSSVCSGNSLMEGAGPVPSGPSACLQHPNLAPHHRNCQPFLRLHRPPDSLGLRPSLARSPQPWDWLLGSVAKPSPNPSQVGGSPCSSLASPSVLVVWGGGGHSWVHGRAIPKAPQT